MVRLACCCMALFGAFALCGCAEGSDNDSIGNQGARHPGGDGGSTDGAGAGGDGSQPDGGSCGPPSCTGCCTKAGACVLGLDHTQCGKSGAPCADCASGGTTCATGLCAGCSPVCLGKACAASDGCGGACQPGSGCCKADCAGKVCGAQDGCGGTCAQGSGCCTPVCSGKKCGEGDGCGGTCAQGSGCCTPVCSGKKCGAGDGCGGTCAQGSGCCTPVCSGKKCGEGDGCGAPCSGPCPEWEWCSSSKDCECGPSPDFKRVGGVCLPSCGQYLAKKGLPNAGGGCCAKGCLPGVKGGGPGSTWDCYGCCANAAGQAACNP